MITGMTELNCALSRPAFLEVVNDDGIVFHGGIQTWYPTRWQRRAGCGPTTGANLILYLSRSRPGFRELCAYDASTKAGLLRLMEEMWRHITPGVRGVNSPGIFVEGVRSFCGERGFEPRILTLPVPPVAAGHRPSPEEVGEFLAGALCRDLPVAFLNLSNGALRDLDHWHWVTLTALNGQYVTMVDQGRRSDINLLLWLKTTTLGGGFVVLEPDGGAQ